MTTTNETRSLLGCPYCTAMFAGDEYPAEDYLADHITDAHQDRLPNSYIDGGNA